VILNKATGDYAMDNVKLIRMVSGEEVIAKVLDETQDGGLVLKNPCILLPAGQGRLALVPWMPYAETENMEVPSKVVAFQVTPKIDLVNEYNTMNSGLIVPDKSVASPKLTLVE
jgi:hypothetical protein